MKSSIEWSQRPGNILGMIALGTIVVMVVSLILVVAALMAISHLERRHPPQMPPDWEDDEK